MDTKKLQKEIYTNKVKKGFNITNIEQEFCLLYGEVAEAFEAYRKNEVTVGEELADVAIYLLGMAEILELDLGAEIEKKVTKNQKRQYTSADGVLKEVH